MAGWPWPLDGVQQWFENLWSWISEAAENAVSVVYGWIWEGVGWLRDRFSEVTEWLRNHFWDPFVDWTDAAFQALTEAAGEGRALTGELVKMIPWPWSRIFEIFLAPFALAYSFLKPLITAGWDLITQAWNSLAEGVNSVGAALSDALGQAKDAVTGGLTNVYTGLAGVVGELGNTVSTAFNGAMETVGGWVSDALAGVAKALGEALAGFMQWITTQLQWLAQSIIGAATAVKDAVEGFFEMVGRSLVATVTTVFSPGSPKPEIAAETETAFNAMLSQIEKLTRLPRRSQPPYEALATAVVSVASRFLLLKLGVEGVGAAVDAAHPIKGLKAHEIAAGLVGIVDMPAVIGPLLQEPIRQGIMIPWSQYWASKYTPQVPGPSDLIRFVVREVISPSEFYEAMPLHGYSERWARAYWDAHWVLPAFNQLVDAYHRGIITSADLDKYVVWHDYSPTPRPGTTKSDLEIMRGLMKTLIPRVDLRRGWELGAIGDEELVQRFRALGYEEDAELMAEIQKREALDAEIGKLRDNAKTDFTKGYISEGDLRATLRSLGYGANLVEYHVQDALQDRERRRKDMLVENYVDAYVKGIIETEDALAQLLNTVLVDPELVKVMVEDAYIRRYKKPRGGVGG